MLGWDVAQRYIHFSSRPEAPEVPIRAVNQFSGGTGPVGVYAYPEDAQQMTFAADRAYSFLLTPTVPMLSTRTYSADELGVDLARLAQLADIARPLRLWERMKREIRGHQLPFTKLWYVLARIPNPHADPDDPLPGGGDNSGFAAPALGRDLLITLGHLAIDDRLGIMYSSEPEQAVFLTNDSFEATPMPRRNPSSRPDFDAELDRMRSHRAQRIAQLRDAFAECPAVIATDPNRGQVLLIKSDELTDRASGPIRVTEFQKDGPRGHSTARSDDELLDRVIGDFSKGVRFTPATEEEVIEWTTSDEFVEGSKRVAFIQAHNTYSYLAQKAGVSYEEIGTLTDRAHRAAHEDIEKGTAVFERAIKVIVENHPQVRRNPSRSLVQNPPWVTQALAESYKLIDDKVPPEWMPQLATVKQGRNNTLVGSLLEYGCGAYGCVLATGDPKTVLKVTSDESEAEFAAQMSVECLASEVISDA